MRTDIYLLAEELINYAQVVGFIEAEDKIYIRNRLYAFWQLSPPPSFADYAAQAKVNFLEQQKLLTLDKIRDRLLQKILSWAHEQKKIASLQAFDCDAWEASLINIFLPHPSQITAKFFKIYQNKKSASTATNETAKKALDWFYDFSQNNRYIRIDRIAKNQHWQQQTPYGHMQITVNLSKPEKDPKAIEKAALTDDAQENYPACVLCAENTGYQGSATQAPRQNHRIIPLRLAKEDWFLQFSPYVYYHQHIIVINREHRPMRVEKKTFQRLAEFADMFPHCFIGSNADLPVVGGSLLAHDHYQGGNFAMPMFAAKNFAEYGYKFFDDVKISWLYWPLTVLILQSKNKKSLIKAAHKLTLFWRQYSHPQQEILAETTGMPHHSVTPILHKIKNSYKLYMTLRENRRSAQHPDGIYHPHQEIHVVKKENIGLVEVMGLAILPARLLPVMKALEKALLEKQSELTDYPNFSLLYQELLQTQKQETNVQKHVQTTIGNYFVRGLQHCGVMPLDKKENVQSGQNGKEAMRRFLKEFKKFL